MITGKRQKLDPGSTDNTAQIQTATEQPFGFPLLRASLLGIPPELRNEIYRHALCPVLAGTALELEGHSLGFIDKLRLRKPCNLSPGLLRVNKQIHKEAIPVLYGQNTFDADRSTFLSFAYRLRLHDNFTLLRSLSLTGVAYTMIEYPMEMVTVLAWLKPMTHLERLELHVLARSQFSEPLTDSRGVAKALFWHAHEWIYAVGDASGHELAAVERIHIFYPEGHQFDNAVFRQELTYFITNHKFDKMKPGEDWREHEGALKEAFSRFLANRIDAI